MTADSDLSTHFNALGLPEPAVEWLLDLWNLIQVLDDAVDGDPVNKVDALKAVRAVFLTMPLNDFYRQYANILQPIVVLQMLKWEAANAVEDAGLMCEKSYVWRGGYYDVVLIVCHLCGLSDYGPTVMSLYGETYAEYREGF